MATELLECAPILEAGVLPKLDMRSQHTLAATHQAVHQWLVALPPCFWQASTLLHGHTITRSALYLSIRRSFLAAYQ